MKLRHLLVAIVIGMLTAAGIGAQQPEYEAVRDSLGRITDVPLLRRMERSLPLPGAARTPDPVVRRGLISLRLWQLTADREDAERSRETFERAVERFPREPWSHYGLGLALAHGPDVRLPLVGGVLPQVTLGQTVAEIIKRDPRSRARRALRAALELEPGFGRAAILLGRLALEDGRSQDLVREARTALVRAREAGDRSAETARALADLETALGNYAEAAAVAGSADAGDAGTARSRGIALLLQPGSESAGYAAYRSGIEALDEAAAQLYFEDVAVLLNPQEAAEWEAARTVGQKRGWLERFWDRRAAEAGVLPAERVAEHYRRLAFARQSFVRNARRGSENTGSLLGEDLPGSHILDDRGVVLVRHGAPLRVVSSTGRGLLPNETWVYDVPDHGPQLFHFVALRGAQDYSLVDDLLDAVDRRSALSLEDRQRSVISLVEDRATFEPKYRATLGRLRQLLGDPSQRLDGTEIRNLLERADADYRRGARQALRTDTYAREYTGALAFHHDIFTFRTPFARTDVTAAVAIPAAELEPLTGSRDLAYALQLSLILTDTLQDVVTRVDTALTLRVPRPLGPDDYLHAHVTLPVVPSEHTLFRVVAEDAVSGRGAVQGGGVRLRDYAGNRLQVSDVVLALPDTAGAWRRGDVALALALPRRFGPDRPFTVFYEIYNLPADAAYVTEVTVEPTEGGSLLGRLFGRGPDRIRLRFEGVAAPGEDGVVQEVRQLASDLRPGRYRLEINVTSRATGESAGTTTVFTVVE